MEKQKPELLIRANMPELDFVRGIAILAVFLLHAFFWTSSNFNNSQSLSGLSKLFVMLTQSGWLGVQLFFVLSGFLITGILLDSKNRPDYYKRFYTRRALRILPAYIALLLILLILGAIGWKFLILSVLFASNLFALFGVALQYGPLWSLAVEEQFYLIWPQFVRRFSRKTLAIIACAIVILVPFLRLFVFIKKPETDLFYYTWFVIDGLASGALLSLYLRSEKMSRKKALYTGMVLLMAGSLIIIIGAPFGVLSRANVLGAAMQLFPWNILFAGFIAIVLILGTSKWKKFVNIAWVRYFGRISYGLYLIHLLIFLDFDSMTLKISPALNAYFRSTFPGLFLRFLIAGGISIIIAAVSRKYFEEFFLKLKDKEYAKKAKEKILKLLPISSINKNPGL
jgi:peptidoglycan/LPS O-acetylase OafA/YrhL